MATTRERLRELVDTLPEDRLGAAEDALEALMKDGIPIDDEPVTDEDLAAIAEVRAELARGETVDHEDAMRSIGL